MNRSVSTLLLIWFLIGMLTLTFNIQPVSSELGTWMVDDWDGEPANLSEVRDAVVDAYPTDAFLASMKRGSEPLIGSFLKNGLECQFLGAFKQFSGVSSRRDFINEIKWSNFAYIDDDSAELVVGLDAAKPGSYSRVVDLVENFGGEFVNTVSLEGKIGAIVASIPLDAMSIFVSEVELSGFSKYVEPNTRFEVDYVPNDPDWVRQWGPVRIEADHAWNITTGDPSILVAVIDTGVDWDHPDLAANYVPLGYDWVNNDPDPMDDQGHGTHVAGSIAAVINNGVGIAGLAQVGIMAEKVLNEDGRGWLSEIAWGIIHAVDQGANIINLSLGAKENCNLLKEAVEYANDHGVLIVASAGNDATDVKQYPAAYNEVVTVSASDEFDQPATFTNYGDWVDIAAPGVRIYSTVWDNSYDTKSGTSMSAPHVAGVAALIWSRFPNMTRDQVRAQLQYTADDLGGLGFDIYYGHGRVNARRATEQAPSDHDILVFNLDVPPYLRVGKTATVNTTILNMGTNPESNITVRLLVNGSIVNYAMIDFLTAGASTTVGFLWNATIEGTYNVTSNAVAMANETITENNTLSKQTNARALQVIKVPEDHSTIQGAIDAANEGDTISVASGTYYENVWINKEGLTLVGESSDTTIIDGKGNGDVIIITADHTQVRAFTIRNSGDKPMAYPPPSGIICYYSEGHTISDTVILQNSLGINIFHSSNTTLRNNNMSLNTYNFGVNGYNMEDFAHDIDVSNTIEGRPLFYLVNERDKQVPSDAGYVALINSTNMTVNNLNLTANFEGVLLAYTTYSWIENVSVSDNYIGINLVNSHNNTVHNGTVTSNDVGIHLWESKTNNIKGNTLVNNNGGVYLYYSKDNAIDFNNLLRNGLGLVLEKSDNNTISGNKALNNTQGICIQMSGHNIARNNNMTMNEYNFGVIGNHISHFIHDADTSNTVNDKPVYYWVDQENRTVPVDAGYVAVVNSTNITVGNLELTNNIQGVVFASTSESNIENVNATNNIYGILLYNSNDNVIGNVIASKNGRGIQLIASDNNIISNCETANNYIGIGLWQSAEKNAIFENALLNGTAGVYLDCSGGNNVGNNTITGHKYGIRLYRSSSNVLRNNNMTLNTLNFGVEGDLLSHFVQDIDASNIVDGKPIYYWVNQHSQTVPLDAGYVAVINGTSVTVKNLSLTNNLHGVLLAYTTNSSVANSIASDNQHGVYLWASDNNLIHGNNMTKNENGVSLEGSSGNIVLSNNIKNNTIGFYVAASQGNTIEYNLFSENIGGIMLSHSHNNIICGNRVKGTTGRSLVGISLTESKGNMIRRNVVTNSTFFAGSGVYLEWDSSNNTIIENTLANNTRGVSIGFWGLYGLEDTSNNNTIYHNNLIENTKQVLNLNSINTWDNGYPSGGNYLSDAIMVASDNYSGPFQNETGSDGICDTPYIIDAKNQDNYPLKTPWAPSGDVNDDGFINIYDAIIFSMAFGSYPGHPRWNLKTDLNNDGLIDIFDCVILTSHFQE